MLTRAFSKILIIIIICSFLIFGSQLVLAQEQIIIKPPLELAGPGFIGIIYNIFRWSFLAFTPLVLLLFFYIYFSLALMSLVKKTQTGSGWMAWVPVVNFYLLSKMAGAHWWPILLLVCPRILYIFIFFIPEKFFVFIWPFTILSFFASMVFYIFLIIWYWRIFKRVGRPGWWALILAVPVIGTMVFLVLLGVAAWGKTGQQENKLAK